LHPACTCLRPVSASDRAVNSAFLLPRHLPPKRNTNQRSMISVTASHTFAKQRHLQQGARAPKLYSAPIKQRAVSLARGGRTRTAALATRRPVTCTSNPTDGAVKADPLETLKGDDLQKWNTCVGMVEKLGIESDQAQDIVSRAFGWGSQAYWRKEKVNEVPEPVEMEECLAYIKEMMGDKDSDVGKVVTGFPEVIALGVDDGPPGLKYAVEFIESEWYMDAKARRMTTARKPKILGCRVDCRGNCAGMCHWCWATA